MHTRAEVITYIENNYGVSGEYIFKEFPQYCVFRHKKNKKWFGLIMNVPCKKLYGEGEDEIDIMDLKLNPELVGLLSSQEGYFPAYHMNKEHWISVELAKIDNSENFASLIAESFSLTK